MRHTDRREAGPVDGPGRLPAPDPHVRRPRIGDILQTGRHGRAAVRRVHDNGRRLDITDRLGRDWTIERAPDGCWLRATIPAATADRVRAAAQAVDRLRRCHDQAVRDAGNRRILTLGAVERAQLADRAYLAADDLEAARRELAEATHRNGPRMTHTTLPRAAAAAGAVALAVLLAGCSRPAATAPPADNWPTAMYPPAPGAPTCATWPAVTNRAGRIRSLNTGQPGLPPAGIAAVAAGLDIFCRQHPDEDLAGAAGFVASCWVGDQMPPADREAMEDVLNSLPRFAKPYPCPTLR